jgi:hypothetical protein
MLSKSELTRESKRGERNFKERIISLLLRDLRILLNSSVSRSD